MTDALLKTAGVWLISWGGQKLIAPGEVRMRYLDALGAANAGDIGPLMNLV